MKILCIDLYRDVIKKKWHKYIVWWKENQNIDDIKEDVLDVDVLICQPFYVTDKNVAELPNLKWIQITGSGYEQICLDSIFQRNILLTCMKGVMSISIAEDVFCKMLFFSRKVRKFELSKEDKNWTSFGYNPWMCTLFHDLYDKTIGILGNGAISSEIVKRAKAFGMHTIAYGRTDKNNIELDEFVTGKEGLFHLAEESDFVVSAIAYCNETHHLVDSLFLDKMKKSAVFINISRGSIVNEIDLIDSLKYQKISAAALDVVEKEPLNRLSPLWRLPNVYLTFHKAGAGDSWIKFLDNLIEYNLNAYISNKELKNIIY